MSKSPKALPALLIANPIASALHFGDNMIRFEHYPELVPRRVPDSSAFSSH